MTLVLALLLPCSLEGQQPKAATLPDVLHLLNSGVPGTSVVRIMVQTCLAFELDHEAESELKSAGADDGLIQKLRGVCHRAPEPTPDEPPDEIKATLPLETTQQPATPVASQAAMEEDIIIVPTTHEENPIENLRPPPSGDDRNLAAGPTFTPMTARPVLRNHQEMVRALQDYYPPVLRDAGIGGIVNLWFFIDENGRVVKTQINESSGYEAFDQAGGQVAEMMQFSPAYNGDRRVPVWIALDIMFEVQ